MTPEGELPITVYPSINVSAYLVSFHDDFSAQPLITYREIFQPYI